MDVRRLVRRSAITMLVVAGVVFGGAAANAALVQAERQSTPVYGERVEVTGGALNVYRHGDGGPTIVMLGGYGTAAPALDFAPLIRALPDFRVVVVEGFGYGYADLTGPARTVENITSELHEALAAVHVETPYILLGHSIAGIYELAYTQRYAGEVAAVVGIDASVPGQMNGLAGQGSEWNRLLPASGLLRLAGTALPALVEPEGTAYTAEERRQMGLMVNWNAANPALLDEARQSDHNFAAVADLTYPADLPVLSLIKREGNPPRWRELHERQLDGLRTSELAILDGGHSLHWTRSSEIAGLIRSFLTRAGVTR